MRAESSAELTEVGEERATEDQRAGVLAEVTERVRNEPAGTKLGGSVKRRKNERG